MSTDFLSCRTNQKYADWRDVSQPMRMNQMCGTIASSLALSQTSSQSHPYLLGQLAKTTKLQSIHHKLLDLNRYNARIIYYNQDNGTYSDAQIVRLYMVDNLLKFDKTNDGFIAAYSGGKWYHVVEINDVSSDTVTCYDSQCNSTKVFYKNTLSNICSVSSVAEKDVFIHNKVYRGESYPYLNAPEKLLCDTFIFDINKFHKYISDHYDIDYINNLNKKWSNKWSIKKEFVEIFKDETDNMLTIYFMGMVSMLFYYIINKLMDNKKQYKLKTLFNEIIKNLSDRNQTEKLINDNQIKILLINALNNLFKLEEKNGYHFAKLYDAHVLSIRGDVLKSILPFPINKQSKKTETAHKLLHQNIAWYQNEINKMNSNNSNNRNNATFGCYTNDTSFVEYNRLNLLGIFGIFGIFLLFALNLNYTFNISYKYNMDMTLFCNNTFPVFEMDELEKENIFEKEIDFNGTDSSNSLYIECSDIMIKGSMYLVGNNNKYIHNALINSSYGTDLKYKSNVLSLELPIMIEIHLQITNWLNTMIKNDYSLGIIIVYNMKNKLLCSTLLSQYQLSSHWRMIQHPLEVSNILLDPNHGEILTSTMNGYINYNIYKHLMFINNK